MDDSTINQLQNLLDRFEGGNDGYLTEGDFVKEVAMIAADASGDIADSLSAIAKQYQDALEEEYSAWGGRGDLEGAFDSVYEAVTLLVENSQITKSSNTPFFSERAYSGLREPKYKSREKLIDMDIDDFLLMALPTSGDNYKQQTVDDLVARGIQFEDLPYLITKTGWNGESQVVGHEGRHRAMKLKSLGYTTIPVVIRDSRIRWTEQINGNKFDYIEQWPTVLISEDGSASIPFPISREQAGQPYQGGS